MNYQQKMIHCNNDKDLNKSPLCSPQGNNVDFMWPSPSATINNTVASYYSQHSINSIF